MVAADDRNIITWSLTPGQAGDAPEAMNPQEAGAVALLMDGAYQDNATRELAQAMGFVPVVPPSPTRREPWPLDKAQHRQRNEVERLFRRLKAWHQMFTRYDKTDIVFAAVG